MIGRYAAQARMSDLSEAQTRNEVLVLGLLFIEMTWWIGGSVIFNFVYSGLLVEGSALEAIASLLGTVVIWIAVGLAMRWLQGRSWQNLILPVSVSMTDFVAVLRWMGGLMLLLSVLSVLPYLSAAEYTRPIWQWLLILPFALVATFVQTSGEEIYFRGFLQSTLAARFSSPLIWAVLPSVLFGLSHVFNADTLAEQVQIVIYTGVFGFFAADLTARTGTLGAAMAFHFAHNAVIFCLYGFEGALESPLALWVFAEPTPYDGTGEASAGLAAVFSVQMLFDTLILLIDLWILWLAARVGIRA